MTSSVAPPPPSPPSFVIPPDAELGLNLRAVYIWVLVAVGLPGNAACLATALTMRVSTATFYVALLAVADSLALLVKLLFHQLATHGLMNAAACYAIYTANYFSCYANWVLVFICFERFFSVCFPMKKQVHFTKRRVHVSAVVLALALLVVFAPSLAFHDDWKSRGGGGGCTTREYFAPFVYKAWPVIVTALYFYIPFLLMSLFTALIIVGLWRHRRARQAIQCRGEVSSAGSGRAERAISIMLLSAALVFLLLTLPACLYHLFLKHLYDLSVVKEAARDFLLEQVVTFLADSNHAVNFFIYFASAAKFRRCLMDLARRRSCLLLLLRSATGSSRNGSSCSEPVRLTQLEPAADSKENLDPPTKPLA